MANKAAALEEALRNSRKNRNQQHAQSILGTNPAKLAQEMLGSGRRTSTPKAMGPAASLASRVGINKRSTSLPRANVAPPRQPRAGPLSRHPAVENARPNQRQQQYTSTSSDPPSDHRSNGLGRQTPVGGGVELNIRGAAGGPYIVKASNFAPGTTAADIESVMQSVGGQMKYCKLASAAPTVIAEMSFVEKAGAEAVIEMFNNKKADGRVLYVVYAESSLTPPRPSQSRAQDRRQPVAEEEPAFVVDTAGDVMMEIDEHAEAREVENRQREERRGRDDRRPRDSPPPSGPKSNPRSNAPSDYYAGGRRSEPQYADGRYGGRGGGGGGGGSYGQGGRGGYSDRSRMYSDAPRRGGGSQSYRP